MQQNIDIGKTERLVKLRSIETFTSLRSFVFESVRSLEDLSEDAKKAINEDIIGQWYGDEPKPEVRGPPSSLDELVWRTLYVSQSIIELQTLVQWARALPSKRLPGSRSDQFKLIWWMYFVRLAELQDRLHKLHLIFATLAPRHNKSNFYKSRKVFAEKLTAPFKSLIDLRNQWLHESEVEFVGLKQLSSLDMFATYYEFDKRGSDLPRSLRKQANAVAKLEKQKLVDLLEKNNSAYERVADVVVSYTKGGEL